MTQREKLIKGIALGFFCSNINANEDIIDLILDIRDQVIKDNYNPSIESMVKCYSNWQTRTNKTVEKFKVLIVKSTDLPEDKTIQDLETHDINKLIHAKLGKVVTLKKLEEMINSNELNTNEDFIKLLKAN